MKHKRIMAALFAGAVSICLMTAHAGAAEQTEDGVTLNVSADKAEYGAGEQIKVAVRVANNSGSDLTEITVKARFRRITGLRRAAAVCCGQHTYRRAVRVPRS